MAVLISSEAPQKGTARSAQAMLDTWIDEYLEQNLAVDPVTMKLEGIRYIERHDPVGTQKLKDVALGDRVGERIRIAMYDRRPGPRQSFPSVPPPMTKYPLPTPPVIPLPENVTELRTHAAPQVTPTNQTTAQARQELIAKQKESAQWWRIFESVKDRRSVILMEMTKEELLQWLTRREKQIHRSVLLIKLGRILAEGLADGEKVMDHYNADEIQAIWEKLEAAESTTGESADTGTVTEAS